MKKLKRPTPSQDSEIGKAIEGYEDTFEATDAQFASARRGRPTLLPDQRKERVTIMLDRDIVERFRATGKGWQTRINEALRKLAG
jgi:uncharacterized protein (DUF4415 family)